MNHEEFDQYLEDLEVRLERLRSLYEQYFMGMERLEPTVARKDVDRRFWTIKREKVRNTARRFKLQMLTQRYNTLQQYWQRTCREIELGTYRRHRLKAERTIGAQAARPRAPSDRAPPEAPSSPEEASKAPGAARLPQITLSAEEDFQAFLAGDFDPAAELDRALDAIVARPEAPQAKPQAPKPVAPPSAPSTSPGLPPAAPAAFQGLDPNARPSPSTNPGFPPPPPPPPGPLPAAALESPRNPLPQRPLPPPRVPPRTSRPPPARPPRPSRSQAPPAAQPPKTSSSLSEARIHELHQRYLAARQGARTVPMTLDRLAESLRSTEARLREQHQGRRIDFEVVLKDGKPVIKPKLG